MGRGWRSRIGGGGRREIGGLVKQVIEVLNHFEICVTGSCHRCYVVYVLVANEKVPGVGLFQFRQRTRTGTI